MSLEMPSMCVKNSAMSTKKCPTCGETDLAQFGKDSHRPDGLATYCKACRAARHAQTYTPKPRQPTNGRDKAKVNAASRKWHKNNPDYGKAYMRQWHKNNPGYVTEYMRQWRKDHREAYNAYHQSYLACKLQNSVADPTGCATRLQQANSVVRNGFTSDLDYIACPAQNHSRIFHTRTERIPGYAWVVFLIFLPGIILIY